MREDCQEIRRCPPSPGPDDNPKRYCTILEQHQERTEVNDLVDDIREAVMDYQVHIPKGLSLSLSNIRTGILTAGYLQQHPSDNREPFILTICPFIVISKQDRADLALLKGMRHVGDAGYLSGDRQGCMKGTRRDVLVQLGQRSRDEQDKHVFWLNGLAGTGKPTIAQMFAEMFRGWDAGGEFLLFVGFQ